MSPVTPVDVFTNAKLQALAGFPQVADAISLMPNLTILRGQILAQVSSANASQVQTLDWSGSGDAPTGGVFTLKITGVDGGIFATAALDYDISNANLKIALDGLLNAAGYAGATVAIGSGPCPADVTVTFGGASANWDMPVMTGDISKITSTGTATLTISATTAGNRLGLFGPYVGTKLANPTTAPTLTPADTGSLTKLTQHVVTYTWKTAAGETLPSKPAQCILASNNQKIGVGSLASSLPLGATGVNYYLDGVLVASNTDGSAIDITDYAAGKGLPTINTAFTITGGRHIAKAIAMYDFRTDNLGRVVYAGAGQAPQNGAYEQTTPAYFKGGFKTGELNIGGVAGVTADVIADLAGVIIKGGLTDGVLVI